MSPTILAVSLFFHILATLIWVGGLLLTVLLVWPEVTRALQENTALYGVLNRLRRRFTVYGNLALAVLIVTGMFQMAADENYDGLLQFDNLWSRVLLLKHIVIVLMVICGLALQMFISPALERTTLRAERGKADPAAVEGEWSKLRRREALLTWINAGMGVVVIALSVYASVL